MRDYLEQRERDLVARVAALSEVLSEALEEWASALNVMPNVRSRKRLDEAREVLKRDGY
jgi:4-aminobutyrate aminotransferase-like enzyme